MSNGALEITNLSCAAGGFHLKQLHLKLRAGEYLTIVGPSGAGKTMLLETIAGLRTALEGRICFGGRELTSLAPEARNLGFAYQDSLLYPFLTVRDNILFGARARGVARKPQIKKRLEEMAVQLGLERLLDRAPRFLSGGEKQRVALARALLLQPPLLLLDEPLAALDWESQEKLRRLLRELQRRERMTVLHVTHDLEEAVQLGTCLAVLEGGRLSDCGRPADLIGHNTFLRRLAETGGVEEAVAQNTGSDQ